MRARPKSFDLELVAGPLGRHALDSAVRAVVHTFDQPLFGDDPLGPAISFLRRGACG